MRTIASMLMLLMTLHVAEAAETTNATPLPSAEELAEFWSWKFCPIRHVGMTLCINGQCIQTRQNVEIYTVCYFEWLRYFQEMRLPKAGS